MTELSSCDCEIAKHCRVDKEAVGVKEGNPQHQQHQEDRTYKTGEIPESGRAVGEDAGNEDINGPQAIGEIGTVTQWAPADPRKNF